MAGKLFTPLPLFLHLLRYYASAVVLLDFVDAVLVLVVLTVLVVFEEVSAVLSVLVFSVMVGSYTAVYQLV